jgi:hypothetical protein
MAADGDAMTALRAGYRAPLVVRDDLEPVPPTWCVVTCQQGCAESWAIDVADFAPRLRPSDVEHLLTPVLLDHEQEHQEVWR